MRKFVFLLCLIFTVGLARTAQAQDQKCMGDPQQCLQIMQLQQDLAAQKALTARTRTDTVQATAQQTSDRAAKLIALSATLAVVLKILISVLSSWQGYFTTDKGKAGLKIGLVSAGFFVFLFTNFGFGIPWWQSVILALGGPGSIMVHELTKLIPVLRGQKKLADVDGCPPAQA